MKTQANIKFEVMTAGLRMVFHVMEKKKICFRKSILFEEMPYMSITILSAKSVLLRKYFLHKTHFWWKKLFQNKNKNSLSSWSKDFLFLPSVVKLMKMVCQTTKLFDKRFFPIKAFNKYTLCISTYYKCTDGWIHLDITDF